MSRNSKRIWPYSSSRSTSSILVSMESPHVTSSYSLIVTLAVSATVFEIFRLKDCWFYPPFPCLTLPLGMTPFEFCDEIWHQKTRVVWLPWWRNQDASFLRFDAIPACDRRTDRRTDRHVAFAKTRASIASRGWKHYVKRICVRFSHVFARCQDLA